MNWIDPDRNPAVSPVLLLEQAVGAGPIPQAYLCCSIQHSQVRVFSTWPCHTLGWTRVCHSR
jgi:hypothetical protein